MTICLTIDVYIDLLKKKIPYHVCDKIVHSNNYIFMILSNVTYEKTA